MRLRGSFTKRATPGNLDLAHAALVGLSIGDALGERYFGPDGRVLPLIEARELPRPPWRWTDDTLMACSLVDELERHGEVHERRLFASFCSHLDPGRGYGPAARRLLDDGNAGRADHRTAASLFGGHGSFGNGAAMRVAPLGAFFAGDLERAKSQAAAQARVTHTHAEGIAGAVAVAVAAALAAQLPVGDRLDPATFLMVIGENTPRSETRRQLVVAAELPASTDSRVAAALLGSGYAVSAQDTVPFALWAAARHLGDYEETFWATVAGLGDRDTTCAIACGVAACVTRVDGIPSAWRSGSEPLPAFVRAASRR